MKQTERIKTMEAFYDEARNAADRMEEALEAYEKVQKKYAKLISYYGSSLWMKDYEDDEKGKLPADLKRGVLSEDLIYDLIGDDRKIGVRMLKLITEKFRNTY